MTTIAEADRKFTTKNRNNEQDMPIHRVQVDREEAKKRRSCREI
jgi:hypothetical protein